MATTIEKPLLSDVVNELTQPIRHIERYQIAKINSDGSTTWIVRYHPTRHPSLIEQLSRALSTGTAQSDGARPGFASKPTARLDAIDALLRIDQQATRWLQVEAHRTGAGLTTPALVREVMRLHNRAPEPWAIERDLRSWWLSARILTGWDDPPWKPDNTCPLCAKRGTLRVRLALLAALCVDCHEQWDDTTIGLLADHIRAENHDDVDTPQTEAS